MPHRHPNIVSIIDQGLWMLYLEIYHCVRGGQDELVKLTHFKSQCSRSPKMGPFLGVANLLLKKSPVALPNLDRHWHFHPMFLPSPLHWIRLIFWSDYWPSLFLLLLHLLSPVFLLIRFQQDLKILLWHLFLGESALTHSMTVSSMFKKRWLD